jgi:hypothetical protein
MSADLIEEGMTKDVAGASGRVTYKDVTDAMARVERELRDGQARLEGKLDAYIVAHQSNHTNEQKAFQDHLVNSAIMGERAQTFSHQVDVMQSDVSDLKEWRAEVRGMTNLVRFTVGASLISAIVSIVTLVAMLRA